MGSAAAWLNTRSNALAISYCAFVAGVVALALFMPALANGFAYDDVAVVLGGARTHSLGALGRVFGSGYWAEDGQGLYRPITTLSFALDWSIARDSSAWFHFTNALLHALASALLTLLLARLFVPAGALLGGLLFAVHPVHVEAIANVVGRGDILATVFVLAACLVWTAESDLPRWRTARPVGVAVLFGLGLLSKENAVVLPVLLVLLDATRGSVGRETVVDYLRQNRNAFALIVTVGIAYMLIRMAVLGGVAPTRLDPTLEVAANTTQRLLTALQAWPEYLRLLFFPKTLLADYGPQVIRPADGVSGRVFAGAVLLYGCLAGGVWCLGRGFRRGALALLWFLIAILPVSNLMVPIGVLVAERTLYLPSVALSFGIAGATTLITFAQRKVTRAATAVAVGIIAVLALRTVDRIPEWRSTDAIMSALLRDRPDSFRAQWYHARLARAKSDTAEAIERYNQALRLWPYRQRLTMEAAQYAVEAGHLAFALQVAGFAADIWPAEVTIHRLMAGAALDLGDTTTARAAVGTGLRIHPHDELLHRMSAVLSPSDGPSR